LKAEKVYHRARQILSGIKHKSASINKDIHSHWKSNEEVFDIFDRSYFLFIALDGGQNQ